MLTGGGKLILKECAQIFELHYELMDYLILCYII